MQLLWVLNSLIPRLHSPAVLAPCRIIKAFLVLHGTRKAGEWSLGTRLGPDMFLISVPTDFLNVPDHNLSVFDE